MSQPKKVFSKNGFPTIKMFDDHFEINQSNLNTFKKYYFSEIKEFRHYDPNKNFWIRLYIATSFFGRIFSHSDSWKFKIIKKNGGEWSYDTLPERDLDFELMIKDLKNNIKE